MYHMTVENEYGQQLELTFNSNFDVLSVTGTNPPVAAINTAAISGMDGTKFNSSRAEQRNIVITLNIHPPIESNRLALYNFFRIKQRVKLYYRNEHRDVFIEGYVESFENNPWAQLQQPQISIICPQPYWLSVDDSKMDFSVTSALFEFPFSIPAKGIEFSRMNQVTNLLLNAGEIEVGGIIQFSAVSSLVKNPKFYNITTGKYFGVDIEMQQGDLITLNTNKGQKSLTLLRAGVTTNIMQDMSAGSSWVQFISGENELSIDADAGASDLRVRLSVTQKFEGV